jgi:hypothetical protein
VIKFKNPVPDDNPLGWAVNLDAGQVTFLGQVSTGIEYNDSQRRTFVNSRAITSAEVMHAFHTAYPNFMQAPLNACYAIRARYAGLVRIIWSRPKSINSGRLNTEGRSVRARLLEHLRHEVDASFVERDRSVAVDRHDHRLGVLAGRPGNADGERSLVRGERVREPARPTRWPTS